MKLYLKHLGKAQEDSFIGVIGQATKREKFATLIIADTFDSQKKYGLASMWYEQGVELEIPRAIRCYANFLFAGVGVERDFEKAIQLYEKGALLGEKNCMFVMGEYFRKTNKNLAIAWYEKASIRGSEMADARLAQLIKY